MKIGLIGYGKMGKEIEAIAIERGHTIGAIVNKDDKLDKLKGAVDVAIEFTQPESAMENIRWCIANQIPVVVGTTGWYQHFDQMVKECEAKQGAVFYATNFSVGVNIVFKINELLASIMENTPGYSAQISETHHIHKKDSPSGTAISLAQGLLQHHKHYQKWEETNPENAGAGVLPIVAYREDEVPGTHEVIYDSEIDTITLRHEAKSRKGFALGSVLAAEFLPGKKGVYNMKDLLNFK
ncbi:4-hydroxy-tetrahydrodipicolinate reductase [bacterium]|nr:4-hydroxy-tetrahydrodipicolinate reductase [bacterium]